MQVSYGGVTFEVVQTTEYHRRPEMSRDGTEMLFMRTRYGLTMLFNGDATSYAGDGNAFAQAVGADPGQTDAAIRYHLMKPRLAFVLASDEGTPLLAVPGPGFDRDPDNGPKPISCSVASVGPKTWRVNWAVEVATIECGPGTSDSGGGAPAILSNRYSQAQATGMDRLTTITTHGVTILNAAVLVAAGATADAFRDQCIPALPLGFQRQSVRVDVHSSGVVLEWVVTDQEMMTSIGATNDARRGTVERFEASFGSSSMGADGSGVPTGFIMARFDGYAWGSKVSSRSAMLSWLARLAIERMALPNGPIQAGVQPVIMRVTHSEKIDSPYVELHIDCKYPPAQMARQGLGNLRADFLGVDVIALFSNDGQNPQMPSGNNTRGTANVLNLVAAIKEACAVVPALPGGTQGSGYAGTDAYLSSTVAVQVAPTDNLPQYPTRYSPNALSSGVYTEANYQSTWDTDQGKVAVPLAGPVQAQSPGNTGGGSTGGGGSSPGNTGGGSTPDAMTQVSTNGGLTSGITGGSSANDQKPTSVILTLSRPQSFLTVKFEAERAFSAPIIPDPRSTASNLVLLREVLSPMTVALGPDGTTPIFRIGGEYRFAAKVARAAGSPIFFGVSPFTSFVFGDSLLGLDSSQGNDLFAHGIVDPPQATGGGGDGGTGTGTGTGSGGDGGTGGGDG